MNMRTGSKFFAWRHAGTAFVLYTISLFVITFGAGAQQQDAVSVSSIVVDPGSPPLVFRPEWRIYRVQVPHAVKSVRVTVTADGAGTVVNVGGKPASSGMPSEPVEVAAGRTVIPVMVSSADGKTIERYSVTVFRSYPAVDWIDVTPETAFPPRDSAGELVSGERMWLFGGYTPEVINDVWRSDDGVTWSKAGQVPDPSGVNIPLNFAYRGKMWVACNNGYFYSTADGAAWSLVSSNAPWKGRYAAGGAVFRDRMWVMGGKKAGEVANDVWSSSDGAAWTCETASAPWSKRQLFSMVQVFHDRLWVLGGGITVYHPFRAYSDVWSSADGRKWTCVTERAPWPPRIWSTSAVYANRLWVFGGFRAEPNWNNFNDVWYSSDGKNWRELTTDTIWSPRHELSAYVHDGKLWVVAGNSWPLRNDVWSLEIKGLTFVTQPVIEEFVNSRYRYEARADFNSGGGPVSYRLVKGPSWIWMDAKTGIMTGVPDKTGDSEVSIEAFDAAGETARQTYSLHVIPVP